MPLTAPPPEVSTPDRATPRSGELGSGVVEPARPRGSRRIGALAGVASLAVHAVLVVLYAFASREDDSGATLGIVPPTRRPEGIEVVRIVEVGNEAAEPASPEEIPDQEVATVPLGPVLSDEVRVEPVIVRPPEGDPTAAERLRPDEIDALLAELDEAIMATTPEELARLRMAWQLEELNDSAAAAAEAMAERTDWTYTDGEGRKWGISPGKLHLGDITIPMPGFSLPLNSVEFRRAQDDAEIARARLSGAARDNLSDRAKAIRERIDRERQEARKRARPDTTRGGR